MPAPAIARKNPNTTGILNFFIPGVGHLYASGGEKWGLFVINLLCAFTGAVLILPWIGNLIVWIVALLQSTAVTNEYNSRAEKWVEERAREEEERVEKEDERRLEEQEDAAREQRIDARHVSGEDLAQRYARLHSLVVTGVLSEDERKAEQGKLIDSSNIGWTKEDVADFLGPFAVLVREGECTEDELAEIKGLYSGLAKDRPTE